MIQTHKSLTVGLKDPSSRLIPESLLRDLLRRSYSWLETQAIMGRGVASCSRGSPVAVPRKRHSWIAPSLAKLQMYALVNGAKRLLNGAASHKQWRQSNALPIEQSAWKPYGRLGDVATTSSPPTTGPAAADARAAASKVASHFRRTLAVSRRYAASQVCRLGQLPLALPGNSEGSTFLEPVRVERVLASISGVVVVVTIADRCVCILSPSGGL